MNIPKRIAQALLNSLKGGVVPRIGLPHITVGRKNEIEALLRDVEVIAEGGASFRIITGKYGSGKSFLLQTLRNYVMQKNFVVADADLSPERRLQGTHGQGLATYRELIKNLSTKTRPDGGALSLILDRWINNVQQEVTEKEHLSVTDPALAPLVENRINTVVSSLKELVHGFDFARLLTLYYQAYINGNDELKGKVLKWFRGEYTTKTEARKELGINIVIGDDDWYEYLKLFAYFFKQAGYAGLLILVDELVNLYKLPNSITRQYNYEKLLTMYNDTMQGKASHIGLVFGCTPNALEDQRRGIFSYEALRSRLAEGRFAQGHHDLLSPVIRLRALTQEEMLVLVEKLAQIHSEFYQYPLALSQQDLLDFMQIEYARIGANEHITPREVIRDFIEVLDILYQNPKIKVRELLADGNFAFAKNEIEESAENAQFVEFEI